MTAGLHLLRIEFRRNPGMWLFPIMVGVMVWIALDRGLSVGAPLWFTISSDIQSSVTLLGPLLGGLAAWVAMRNHRRRVDELLSTTPYPAVNRDCTAFAATLAWGALAYILGAVAIILLLSFRAPWGLLHLPTILVGLCIIAAQSAVGYAAGYYIPSRFTAPLATVLLWFSYITPRLIDNRLFWTVTGSGTGFQSGYLFSNLSPVDLSASYDVFRGLLSDPSLGQALWFTGLGTLALVAVVLKRHRSPVVWVGLLAAIAVASVGAIMLIQFDQSESREVAMLPYNPVCAETESRLPVCVHPAYQRMLPGVTKVVGQMTGPLAGLPGAPRRAEQSSPTDFTRTFSSDGTFGFTIATSTSNSVAENRGLLARDVAMTLVYDAAAMPVNGDGPDMMTGAQEVVDDWLLAQAGFVLRELAYEYPDGSVGYRGTGMSFGPEETAALERFTALEPDVRRAWLEENYQTLRSGRITLEDLP